MLPVAGASDFYRQDKKAKIIPVPTFDGTFADWRSFWRHFSDYISKLRDVTDDEKLSFLLESLKHDGTSDLVQAAITNGDSFSTVERCLKKEFDWPRDIYLQAVKKLLELPAITHDEAGIQLITHEFTKQRDCLSQGHQHQNMSFRGHRRFQQK